MAVSVYTCTSCGIQVRAEENQNHTACACNAPFDVQEEVPNEVIEE